MWELLQGQTHLFYSQMKAEIRRLKRALEKRDQSHVTDSGVSSESGMVDCFYKALSLDANHLARPDPITTASASGLRRVPSEVAAFFNRYQGLICQRTHF